jgi:hypothetical protein
MKKYKDTRKRDEFEYDDEKEIFNDVEDVVVSTEPVVTPTTEPNDTIPEDQEEKFGKFSKRPVTEMGDVENGSEPMTKPVIPEPEPIPEVDLEEYERQHKHVHEHEHVHDVEDNVSEPVEVAPQAPRVEFKPNLDTVAGVDEELNKKEMLTKYDTYFTMESVGNLSYPKTMTLYDIYQNFVKHRSWFIGLTSKEDLDHITEFMTKNKVKYNDIILSDDAKNQFIRKLQYNTDYVMARKLKNK